MQKVIICMIAGFLAASLIEWGKTFVTGADDALNGEYKHRTEEIGRSVEAQKRLLVVTLRIRCVAHENRFRPNQLHRW